MPHKPGHNPHSDSSSSSSGSYNTYNSFFNSPNTWNNTNNTTNDTSNNDSNTGYFGSNEEIKNQIKDKVKNILGLTTVPNTPPPGTPWSGMDSSTSTYAANLEGKDKWFYGKEASYHTNMELVNAGYGTYNETTGSFTLSPEGWKIKYGTYTPGQAQDPGAMGSGDPGGILTSIPISNKMLQRQNYIKGAALGLAGAFAGGNLAGVAMRAASLKSFDDAKQKPGKAYETYMNKFKAKQEGKKFTQTSNMYGKSILGLSNEVTKNKEDLLGS